MQRTILTFVSLALAAICGSAISKGKSAVVGTRTSTDDRIVLSQSGQYRLTHADLEAAFVLYDVAAGEPLSPADHAELETILISEFQRKPAEVVKNYTQLRQAAAAIGEKNDLFQEAKVRGAIWESLATDFGRDQAAAGALRLLERRVPPIASGDAFVITRRDVDALFDLQGVVVRFAGLPATTKAARASYSGTLARQFPEMSKPQKTEIAQAELRGLAAAYMLNDSGIRYAVGKEIHGCVHASADLPIEARSLGYSGLKFMSATGQYGILPSSQSKELADRIASSAEATMIHMKLQTGQLFGRMCRAVTIEKHGTALGGLPS
jgi:hypothetical protein